jgi:hypothetical protein
MCKYQSDRELQFSRCSDIGQRFAPIGLHKTDAASDWLLFAYKTTLPQVRKACREYRCKNNRITQVIGVILAFTGKKMFYFNQKSEVSLKNSITSRGPC